MDKRISFMTSKLCIFGILAVFTIPNLHAQRTFSTHLVQPVRGNHTETFKKIELGLRIPDSLYSTVAFLAPEPGKLNPYDPADVDIVATFSNGTLNIKRHGFVYVPYERGEHTWTMQPETLPFRVRFAAPQAGEWKAEVVVKLKGVEVYKSNPISLVVQQGELPGYLVLDKTGTVADRYLRFSGSGKTFMVVGENLGFASYDHLKPSDHKQMMQWMNELSSNGGNYMRLWMRNPAYGLEQEHLGHYGKRMVNAWELDQVVEMAEIMNLYLQVHLINDEFTPDGGWPDITLWKNNPYNKELGLKDVKLFYQHPMALQYIKRRFRYVEARWGYSTAWAVNEIISEPDESGNYHDKNDRKLLLAWGKALHSYLRDSLASVHPTCISFMLEYPDFKVPAWRAMNVDIASINQYSRHMEANFKRRAGIVQGVQKKKDLANKPFIFSEMAANVYPSLDYCSDISFHNAIWSTLHMGSLGTGLNWWWDNALHLQGHYTNFKALSEHVKRFDPVKKNMRFSKGYYGALSYEKAHIEWFALVADDKSEWHGWVHNNTWWWARKYTVDDCINKMVEDKSSRSDKADITNYRYRMGEKYFRPSVLKDNYRFVLKGLKPNCTYKVMWFRAYGNGEPVQGMETTVKSNLFGKAKLTFPQTKDLPDGDFALSLIVAE